MQRRVQGFTLIELLVTIVIISILSAIAYPMYQDQVRKSRRGVAKGALLELSQFMERYYTVENSYEDAGGNPPTLPFTTSPENGTTYYALSVAVDVSGIYTLTATPTALQSADSCSTMTLTGTGNHTPAGCW